MRKLTLLAATVLISNAASADTKTMCVNKWPDNYTMQEHCIESETDANHQMFKFAGANNLVSADGTLSASSKGGDAERILNKCMIKWQDKKFSTYNFNMVVHCVESQVGAYNRLNSPSIQLGYGKNTSSTGTSSGAYIPQYKGNSAIKPKRGESDECAQARQYLKDLKGAGLSGTAQYEKQEALVAQCK